MAISSTWRSTPPAPCAITRLATGVITVAILRRTSCADAIRPPMLSFRGSAPDSISAPDGHARHKRTWVIRAADRDRLRINPEPALNQRAVLRLAPLAADR